MILHVLLLSLLLCNVQQAAPWSVFSQYLCAAASPHSVSTLVLLYLLCHIATVWPLPGHFCLILCLLPSPCSVTPTYVSANVSVQQSTVIYHFSPSIDNRFPQAILMVCHYCFSVICRLVVCCSIWPPYAHDNCIYFVYCHSFSNITSLRWFFPHICRCWLLVCSCCLPHKNGVPLMLNWHVQYFLLTHVTAIVTVCSSLLFHWHMPLLIFNK